MFQAGQSVHIGGLTRLDVLKASVQTIYITVWASPSVSLHLGKTENAEELRDKHFGIRLQVCPTVHLIIENSTIFNGNIILEDYIKVRLFYGTVVYPTC